jgi:DNA-directed RNA polymerase specialized sigma24 family protein
MSDYEGLTYDEIGRITGTSLSTIRIRVYRAKARLRKMLLPIIGDDVDNFVEDGPGEE